MALDPFLQDLGLPPLEPLFPEASSPPALLGNEEIFADHPAVLEGVVATRLPFFRNLSEGLEENDLEHLITKIWSYHEEILSTIPSSGDVKHFAIESSPFLRPVTAVRVNDLPFLFVHFNQEGDRGIENEGKFSKSLAVEFRTGRRYAWVVEKRESFPQDEARRDFVLQKEFENYQKIRFPTIGIASTMLLSKDGCLGLSMRVIEWYETSLLRYLSQHGINGALPEKKALDWSEILLQGLVSLHESGVVHRSITLNTIKIVWDEAAQEYTPKLSDLSDSMSQDHIEEEQAHFPEPRHHLILNGLLAPRRPFNPDDDVAALGFVIYQMTFGPLPQMETIEAAKRFLSRTKRQGAIGRLIGNMIDFNEVRRPSAADALAILRVLRE